MYIFIPHLILTRFMGWLANSRNKIIKNLLIKLFIKLYKPNLEESLISDINDFSNYNSFFTRFIVIIILLIRIIFVQQLNYFVVYIIDVFEVLNYKFINKFKITVINFMVS